jgi:hypothetical protein
VIGFENWADLPGSKVYKYLTIYAKKFSLLEKPKLETRSRKSPGMQMVGREMLRQRVQAGCDL